MISMTTRGLESEYQILVAGLYQKTCWCNWVWMAYTVQVEVTNSTVAFLTGLRKRSCHDEWKHHRGFGIDLLPSALV